MLDVHAPGVDKGDDEEDGQHAVEEDLEGVVAVYLGIGVQDLVIFLVRADGAEGGQLAQPQRAGRDHIEDEYGFEGEEEDATQDLPPCDIAEAHDDIGDLGLPVAVGKGGDQIL